MDLNPRSQIISGRRHLMSYIERRLWSGLTIFQNILRTSKRSLNLLSGWHRYSKLGIPTRALLVHPWLLLKWQDVPLPQAHAWDMSLESTDEVSSLYPPAYNKTLDLDPLWHIVRSRSNPVTGYGLDGRGDAVRFPAKENYLLSTASTQSRIQWVPEALSFPRE